MEKAVERNVERREASELPSALRKSEELKQKLEGKKLAVFLDYDGCLSPIVKNPEEAILSDPMRAVLEKLAAKHPVAVVSGRDRKDVEELVGLQAVYFAGSHGFDITGPGGMKAEPGEAKNALPALDQAETELKEHLQGIAGAQVERKRYAIAVHYRNVAPEQVEQVKGTVEAVLARHKELKKGLGKKIVELKPNLNWHKGEAILWLLEELALNSPDVVPVFIGDDITDEDAFAALQGRGLTVLVGEHEEKTAASYRLKDVEEVRVFLDSLA